MPSENSQHEADLLPFGAPQVDPVDPSVRAKLTNASSGKQKIERNPRALRPLWYSIPVLVIVLTVAAYLIGLSLVPEPLEGAGIRRRPDGLRRSDDVDEDRH